MKKLIKTKANMKKICSVVGFMWVMCAVQAQMDYTPFPKDSLSWHIWGGRPGYYETGPTSYGINGKETLIDGNVYSQVWGNGKFVVGVREENKKIFAYIPVSEYYFESKEHLLYDFNLEIGDTIFYSLKLQNSWGDNFSIVNYYMPGEHYAVVKEKGIITLENGSVRNTISLERSRHGSIQWIEGIGGAEMIGLLDPLCFGVVSDYSRLFLTCICESKNPNGCLLNLYNGEYEDEYWQQFFKMSSCPCRPNDDMIVAYEENEITISPNPINNELRVINHGLPVTEIEIFDIFGIRQKAESINGEGETTIDLRHLSAGLYFVKIITENKVFIKKVIKN